MQSTRRADEAIDPWPDFRGQQMENEGRIESSATESILQAVDQTDAPKQNFSVRAAGPPAVSYDATARTRNGSQPAVTACLK